MTPYDRDRVTLSQLVLEELAGLRTVFVVVEFGARKYPDRRWLKQSAHEHVTHAIEHGKAWLAGTKIDPESKISNLAHMGLRSLFAVAKELGIK